jgi:hypothetical protein
MSTLEFKAHGERIRREYAPALGELEGMAGSSTDESRPGGQVSGIVRRYPKHETTYSKPQALGWIKGVHAAAIEYASVTKELKGYAFMMGVSFFLIFFCAGLISGFILIPTSPQDDLLGTAVALIIAIAFLAASLYFLIFFLRHDLFRPADLPIIFDRRNRKVFRILREEQSGLRGLFKPWPLMACEYDWDLVDTEHQADVYTTGGTLHRDHYLMFIVRKSENDPTIIDSFQIGSSLILDDQLVDAMWEHIRRFMEEQGPHLPSIQEPLADLQQPIGWWQSMGAVGFLGPNYSQHWRDSPVVTFALHLAFPVTIPMLLLWGTGNWLSYKTAVPVQWPEEVMRAVQG